MTMMRAVFRTWTVKIAGLVLLGIVLVALFANFLMPDNPYTVSAMILRGPSAVHWLGTDEIGRDTLSRIMLGTRVTLVGAVEAVGIGAAVGVIPGLFSVFLDRWQRFLALRVIDTFMTLPTIVFTIGVVAVFGNSQNIAMAAIGLLFTPLFFRLTRSSALGFVKTQYVEAAQLLGLSRWQIIRVHIWRKVLPTVAVAIAQHMASGILVVSSLSFLGIGAQPPLPTWGGMLSEDLPYLAQNGYEAIFPGIAIVLTVGALSLIADGIRDATGATGDLQVASRDTLIADPAVATARADELQRRLEEPEPRVALETVAS